LEHDVVAMTLYRKHRHKSTPFFSGAGLVRASGKSGRLSVFGAMQMAQCLYG